MLIAGSAFEIAIKAEKPFAAAKASRQIRSAHASAVLPSSAALGSLVQRQQPFGWVNVKPFSAVSRRHDHHARRNRCWSLALESSQASDKRTVASSNLALRDCRLPGQMGLDSWAGSCLHHHLGLNDADERSGGNEHSADVTALGVVLLRGLQSNAEMRSAAGVAMRFTARLGYTADLSGGVQFAWFVRARNAYELALCAAMSCMGIPAQSGTVHIRAFPCQGITVLCSEREDC